MYRVNQYEPPPRRDIAIERRRRLILLGFVAPCGLGAGLSLILVALLFANDRSSAARETGAVIGQLAFLFLWVGVIFAIACACTTASGLLVYLSRRNRYAPWLGWLPWVAATALLFLRAPFEL
jgi:hypothetical protein